MYWNVVNQLWGAFATVTIDAVVLAGLALYGFALLLQALQVFAILIGLILWPIRTLCGWPPAYVGPTFAKLGRRSALFTNLGCKMKWPLVNYPIRTRTHVGAPMSRMQWEIPPHPKFVSGLRLSALKNAASGVDG